MLTCRMSIPSDLNEQRTTSKEHSSKQLRQRFQWCLGHVELLLLTDSFREGEQCRQKHRIQEKAEAVDEAEAVVVTRAEDMLSRVDTGRSHGRRQRMCHARHPNLNMLLPKHLRLLHPTEQCSITPACNLQVLHPWPDAVGMDHQKVWL